MVGKMECHTCQRELPVGARYCPNCGRRYKKESVEEARAKENLNLPILYIMVGSLILAVMFPPWESPPGDAPEYLGMHFVLSPPSEGAVISRMLQSIELVTIAVAGLYGSWLFRERP